MLSQSKFEALTLNRLLHAAILIPPSPSLKGSRF